MARPFKCGLDYFPHDTDAAKDEKLEALQYLYGNDGYAFYFKLSELIYRSENAELPVADDEAVLVLCRKYLLIEPEKFREILSSALKWGCFDQEAFEQRKVLTSAEIKQKAGLVLEKRKAMQERYEKIKCQKAKADKQVFAAETPVSEGFRFTRERKEKQTGKIDLYPDNIPEKKGETGEREVWRKIDAAEIPPETREKAGQIWQEVLRRLRQQITAGNYRTWLEKSRGLICRDGLFVIGVPGVFEAEYLNTTLRPLIECTLIQVTRQEQRISFSILES